MANWTRRILRFVVTVALVVAVAGVLWFSWTYAGPIATIAYVALFLMGFGLLPGAIVLIRDLLPNFIGRLTFALGQLAHGGSWLVQVDNGWELCPHREHEGVAQYYYAGEWHTVEDDSHQTRLAWSSFGITWHKLPNDLAEYRVDAHARDPYDDIQPDADADAAAIARANINDVIQQATQQHPVADGGEGMTARLDPDLTAQDGVWVVNYRDYFRGRIDAIGETGLLDDVERVAQRDEALANAVSEHRMLIGSAFGLIAGAITGYVAMVGF